MKGGSVVPVQLREGKNRWQEAVGIFIRARDPPSLLPNKCIEEHGSTVPYRLPLTHKHTHTHSTGSFDNEQNHEKSHPHLHLIGFPMATVVEWLSILEGFFFTFFQKLASQNNGPILSVPLTTGHHFLAHRVKGNYIFPDWCWSFSYIYRSIFSSPSFCRQYELEKVRENVFWWRLLSRAELLSLGLATGVNWLEINEQRKIEREKRGDLAIVRCS